MQHNQTIAAYDKYANIYDEEVIEFWRNFPHGFIEKFAENLPGRRILNLGSGSGRDALLLRDCGLEVICVDASKPMVAMTTELGFESYRNSFAEFDFPESSFDGVWAYTSLIHVSKSEAKQVIKKLHKQIKPDGIFAIGVIKGDTEGMVERESMPGTSRYFKHYQSAELQELVEPLGFGLLYEQEYKPNKRIYLNQLYKCLKNS